MTEIAKQDKIAFIAIGIIIGIVLTLTGVVSFSLMETRETDMNEKEFEHFVIYPERDFTTDIKINQSVAIINGQKITFNSAWEGNDDSIITSPHMAIWSKEKNRYSMEVWLPKNSTAETLIFFVEEV